MKSAAIGIRVHSGWGALVALSGGIGAEEVVERTRVVVIDPGISGMVQPYHFAEKLEIRAGEEHVMRCAGLSGRLALAALRAVIRRLEERGYRVTRSAILLSSGRTLPAFPKILASHALIHTAEGEFFRRAFRDALDHLQIQVIGIRERDLDECTGAMFGRATPGLRRRMDALGRSLGPPWTKDQKNAALAAALALSAHGDGAWLSRMEGQKKNAALA